MKNLSLIIAIIICWINSLVAQQQTPAWLFPIMFKDYNGERDTIYIGCDANATIFDDTVYGEQWNQIDTTKFHAGIDIWQDSAIKVKIVPDSLLSDWAWGSFQFQFHKGRMPLTMYWYDTLFYSDSLPYPNLLPKPRARGDLACCDGNPIYGNCPSDAAIIMTDMKDSLPFGTSITFSDSIVFNGDSSQPGISVGCFFLRIMPFDSPPTGGSVNEYDEAKNVTLYPNPSSIFVTLKTEFTPITNYRIYNNRGESIVFHHFRNPQREIKIDTKKFSNGFYFVEIETKQYKTAKKFIIIK